MTTYNRTYVRIYHGGKRKTYIWCRMFADVARGGMRLIALVGIPANVIPRMHRGSSDMVSGNVFALRKNRARDSDGCWSLRCYGDLGNSSVVRYSGVSWWHIPFVHSGAERCVMLCGVTQHHRDF